jgi:hypothetical protein
MPSPGLIPLVSEQADYDETAGAPRLPINMLAQGAPGERPRPMRARPGIRAWSDFPTAFESTAPVVAMGMIGNELLYATDDGFGTRRVFTWSAGAVYSNGTAANNLITGIEPVKFAIGRSAIVALGGNEPQKLAAFFSERLGGGPPHAIDGTFISQYLVLVQRGPLGLFFWSEPGDTGIETWDLTFELREAEARPDALVGCDSTAGELYMFGESTSQVYLPDPDQTFAPSTTLESGMAIGARRSVIRVDKAMAWLDDSTRFRVSSLRGEAGVISDNAIAELLRKLPTVSDCWGFRFTDGGHDLLVWAFPSAGKTFCYDMNSQHWCEWLRWANGRWQSWAPCSYLHAKALRKHLVGMPDGSIAELSLDAYSDLADSLRWEIVTGFSGGAGKRHAVEVQWPMRRGQASSATAAVNVTWRDDGGAFLPDVAMPLGTAGSTAVLGIVSPAGEPYQLRQWKLSGAAAEAYSIAPGRELFEEVDF